MVNRLLIFLVLGAVALAAWGGVAGAADTPEKGAGAMAADEAYNKAMTARRAVEPIEERLAITKKFLDDYPESSHTANAISAVVYYQGNALDDMDGAIAYAEAIRAKITDPDVADALDKELMVVYGEAGKMDKMLAIANTMEAGDKLKFNDYWSIIESGMQAEEWKLVRDYCVKAKGMANAETFKSDWPDNDVSGEELKVAGDNRTGMLMIADGWARANQGETDEALADFAAADKLVRRSMFDRPEYNLNTYWAKTSLMKGDYQAAIDRCAIDALVMKNKDALAGLKTAYAGLNGSEDGFDAYTKDLHKKIAPPVEDFELADYDGKSHKYGDLKGQVTLLAFWFPT